MSAQQQHLSLTSSKIDADEVKQMFLSCQRSSFRNVIALNLQKIASKFVDVEAEDVHPALRIFHGARAPAIELEAYAERISRYLGCGPECFVLAVVYLDRLLRDSRYTSGLITPTSVHRVFFTAVLGAAKYRSESAYAMSYYSSICGVTPSELCSMEISFLKLIDFNLSVSPAEYTSAMGVLAAHPKFAFNPEDTTPLLSQVLALRCHVPSGGNFSDKVTCGTVDLPKDETQTWACTLETRVRSASQATARLSECASLATEEVC